MIFYLGRGKPEGTGRLFPQQDVLLAPGYFPPSNAKAFLEPSLPRFGEIWRNLKKNATQIIIPQKMLVETYRQ